MPHTLYEVKCLPSCRHFYLNEDLLHRKQELARQMMDVREAPSSANIFEHPGVLLLKEDGAFCIQGILGGAFDGGNDTEGVGC